MIDKIQKIVIEVVFYDNAIGFNKNPIELTLLFSKKPYFRFS